MFDSIVKEASEKFGTSGKTGKILVALLDLMTNPATDGFHGFVEKFRRTGLGDLVDSWIRVGDNRLISSERLAATLGVNQLDSIAGQAEVDRETAAAVVAFMTPRVVDRLTPNGDLLDEAGVLKLTKRFSGNATSFIGGDSGAISKYILPVLLLALLFGIVGYFLFKPNHPAMNASHADNANQPGNKP